MTVCNMKEVIRVDQKMSPQLESFSITVLVLMACNFTVLDHSPRSSTFFCPGNIWSCGKRNQKTQYGNYKVCPRSRMEFVVGIKQAWAFYLGDPCLCLV